MWPKIVTDFAQNMLLVVHFPLKFESFLVFR